MVEGPQPIGGTTELPPDVGTCAVHWTNDRGYVVRCRRRSSFGIGEFGSVSLTACTRHLAIVLRSLYAGEAEGQPSDGPFTVVPLG